MFKRYKIYNSLLIFMGFMSVVVTGLFISLYFFALDISINAFIGVPLYLFLSIIAVVLVFLSYRLTVNSTIPAIRYGRMLKLKEMDFNNRHSDTEILHSEISDVVLLAMNLNRDKLNKLCKIKIECFKQGTIYTTHSSQFLSGSKIYNMSSSSEVKCIEIIKYNKPSIDRVALPLPINNEIRLSSSVVKELGKNFIIAVYQIVADVTRKDVYISNLGHFTKRIYFRYGKSLEKEYIDLIEDSSTEHTAV